MNEIIERIPDSKDWITTILLIVMALLIFNKLRHGGRFHKLLSLLFNNNYINKYSKSIPLILNVFNIIFIIIIVVVISLLLFVVIGFNDSSLTYNNVKVFFTIFLSVFSFVIIRFILGFLLGVLFEKEKEQQYFTFLKISYLSNFCILILPLLICNFYIDTNYFSQFLIVMAILLLLFYYFLQIKDNQKFIFDRLFYFILYLCALEIAPFIIIYRVVI